MNKKELQVLNDILVLLTRSVRLEKNGSIRQEYQRTITQYRLILMKLNDRRDV